MEEEQKKEYIKNFINNRAMSQAVYDVLLDIFLKSEPKVDVHVLASQKLAIDLLLLSWKELEKLKNEVQVDNSERTQIGL